MGATWGLALGGFFLWGDIGLVSYSVLKSRGPLVDMRTVA